MNNDLIETIDYKGVEIEIYYDTDASSPADWDNDDAFLVYDHRDFCIEVKGFDPEEIFEGWQAKQKLFEGYRMFPVYAYIHSGVSLSLGRNSYPHTCNFDTSFKGFMLVKREKYTWTLDQAYKRAQGLIEVWNLYLSGQVYGYYSEHGSCWGFYGDESKEDMIREAKSEIDHALDKKRQSHFQQLKTWIVKKVPLTSRKPCLV